MSENGIYLKNLESKASRRSQRASLISVHSNTTLNRANEFLKGIKALQKEINGVFDPIIKDAHKLHKVAVGQKKKYEEPLRESERLVKKEMGVYIAKLAEAKREAEEKARQEAEERFRKARAAEAMGEKEKAKELREEETKEIVIPEAPKLKGTYTRTYWKWEQIDITKIPGEYLISTVNNLKVDMEVQANKEKTNIPGIRVYSEDIVVTKL